MKFSQGNLGVVVCSHVRDNLRPVLLATHYDDGDWAFTCGQADHAEEEDEYSLVGVGHLDPASRRIPEPILNENAQSLMPMPSRKLPNAGA